MTAVGTVADWRTNDEVVAAEKLDADTEFSARLGIELTADSGEAR